jgi:hypothetical protein
MVTKGRFCNMGPCPGALYCGVHVAEVVALGAAPQPPPINASSKVGHGACSAKNRIAGESPETDKHIVESTDLAQDPATPRSGGSGSVGGGSEGRQRKGRDWRKYGARVPCPHDPRHTVYERDLARHLLTCPKFMQTQREMRQPYFCKNINAAGPTVADLGEDGDNDADEEQAAEEREEQMRAGRIDPRRALRPFLFLPGVEASPL